MSNQSTKILATSAQTLFIEKEFKKVAKDNGMNTQFNWSKSVKSFDVFTMYSDKTPTVTSSNTQIIK